MAGHRMLLAKIGPLDVLVGADRGRHVAGDDTASIQTAINAVAAMPLGADGFRGAVLLNAGSYDINTQLTIGASGIVLRGVGRKWSQSTVSRLLS